MTDDSFMSLARLLNLKNWATKVRCCHCRFVSFLVRTITCQVFHMGWG